MEELLLCIKYIVLGVSLAAPVGPINIEMIRRGIHQGFYSSWFVGLGGMTADLVFLILIFLGIAPLLQIKLVQVLLYALGFVLLSYLGVSSIVTGLKNKAIGIDDREEIDNRSFLSGFMIAAFNPINIVFWFGIYGSSLHQISSGHSTLFIFACSLSILVGIFLWNLNLAFTIYFSKQMLKSSWLKWITIGAGILLIVYAVDFARRLFVAFI
ncbi:amino acid transporter [Bacillus coahuilensis m2-6]|uniref:LysE family translocator n=1 Tax=Bacillus coahuilensis TaxID=408580 RepID=UPI0001850AE9|nr:LysE family transporter [Bacillus coahuilensis]KUP09163.1 amino acid transporter [Bacillus coahuilensis m2-6]